MLYFSKLAKKIIIKRKLLWEKIQGVDFSKSVTVDELCVDPEVANWSSPSGNKYLENVLNDLNICQGDKIIDIGCGKGSAIRTMLRYPFSHSDGVELSEYIADIARSNYQKLKINRCTIITKEASQFVDYDSYNFIYFYNPFPCHIMTKVMNNVIESIKRNNRKLIIIYNNPVCYREISQSGVFSIIGEYPAEWKNKIYVYSNRKYTS